MVVLTLFSIYLSEKFFLEWYWGLNSGPLPYQARGVLPLESDSFALVIFQVGTCIFA
jgi:hypothetical protein